MAGSDVGVKRPARLHVQGEWQGEEVAGDQSPEGHLGS